MDDVFQVRSKDDESIHKFCLADSRTATCPCSGISALPTLPDLPPRGCKDLTTEVTTFKTTELTTFSAEETGTVSVSSESTSKGSTNLPVDAVTIDSVSQGDKSSSSTPPVDELNLTVTSLQQSTRNLDLLSSTTNPRNEILTTTSNPSATSPELLRYDEGSSISSHGPNTSPTDPIEIEFISDITNGTDLIMVTDEDTTVGAEMFSEQGRGLSKDPLRETKSPTVVGATLTPTTDGSENPNAALIIGLSSLGVFLLIMVAVILFYKCYYKPKKSRSLTVTPTSRGSPQEVNRPSYYHDPVKSYVELNPANTLQAWDGKNETIKESSVKGDDVNSPPLLPPVEATSEEGISDTSKPKDKKKKKKKKKKTSEADELGTFESPAVGNGTGGPKEVIT